MLENIFSVSYLILGFVFTFFVPGFCIIESFYSKLKFRIKFPLYFILSLLVSTYVTYFISLLIGFSRTSILISILIFLPWFVHVFRKRKNFLRNAFKKYSLQLIFGTVIYLIFFLALFPGIFTFFKGYVVMSSVNWQDTAMHMEIIQSISQGNFPPQAPYYSGVPLSYYYFADFHSAILATLYGKFFPRVLVYDNPFFAAIFFFSLYALGYEVTRKRIISLVSSFCGVMFGSYIFVHFFIDAFGFIGKNFLFKNIFSLLSTHTYSMEYEKIFQMANMADYFMQNRPMMVGLPVVTMVLCLIIYSFQKKDLITLFLAGVLCGLLLKFQFFAVLVSVIIFSIGFIFYFKKSKFKFFLKSVMVYLLPLFGCFLFFLEKSEVGDSSLIDLVRQNLSFGVWDKSKDFLWHLKFIISNFGLPFLISVFIFLKFITLVIRRKKISRNVFFLTCLVLIFFLIPYSVRFTVYKGDMFKFFYFMVPLSVMVTFWLLGTQVKNKNLLRVIIFFLAFSSSFSSVLTLVNSALNKNQAYTKEEYAVGIWIRNNTPQKSIFISLPTVHTPTSQIGGRLRILSYINWPYSHGYNVGNDNVFARLKDMEGVYFLEDREEIIKTAMKYKADYIYYGLEERAKAPKAEAFFDSLGFLRKVYSSEGIAIYEI